MTNLLAPLGIFALRPLFPEQFWGERGYKLQGKILVGDFEDKG